MATKGVKYEHILGKGRDMASDEYAPDADVTIDTEKPMAGANRVVGEGASTAGAGRGKINPAPVKKAKGGTVRGWGQARGARAAKVC